MFAFLGVIISVLVVVDYYTNRLTRVETVTKKYYIPTHNTVKYYIYTDKNQIQTENDFFENVNVGDKVSFQFTSIFNTDTNVTLKSSGLVRNYKLDSVYGWPLIIVASTFVTSLIVVIKTLGFRKGKREQKSNTVINIGVVNAFLCLMTLAVVLFNLL